MTTQDLPKSGEHLTQIPSQNKITDEMAMDYAIFLYNLYRNQKTNYNFIKGK